MSSAGCSPSKSSALQDDSAASSRKPLRIRFLMKWREVVRTGVKESSEDSGSKAPVGNFITILNDEWPYWFTGRRGRKRKPAAPADATETPEAASSMTTTKEESKVSPITEGEATTSTLFVASAQNAAEHEATVGHVICNNNEVKSVAANEEPKTHKCKSCPAAFATGQQLGGHMRAHFKGTLTISASSKRTKGKGIAQAGASSGAARDIARSVLLPLFKYKNSNPSLSTDDRTKDTSAADSSSRSVTREFLIPFDLNEPAPLEEEEQLNIHEDQMLDLTLSFSTRSSLN